MRVRNTGKRSGQQEIWYSEAPPRVLKDGTIPIKTWQKLPSMLVEEWCKKKKRPAPLFLQAKSFQENVIRFRVVLPDPGGQKENDLVFCPFESKLKTKNATIAKEEAGIVAFFTIFSSPEIFYNAEAEQAELAKKAKKPACVYQSTKEIPLNQTEEFAAVLKVLPDPWKGFWVGMGKGDKGCLKAERWYATDKQEEENSLDTPAGMEN